MKKSLIKKTIIFVLFLLFLSGCKQTIAVEETQALNINELQSTSTMGEKVYPTDEAPPPPTAPLEILNEDLAFPIEEFSVAVEISQSVFENIDFELLQSLGVKYIRFNGILWSEIQPTEDVFLWERMLKNEVFFRKANQYGMTVIPIVRGTPVWAQKVSGYYCGAILEEKLESFSFFMSELVNRYKTDEFNVHYWEIWNEPDVHPEVVINNSVYGCWGDLDDPYYGGEYYANMLSIVAPLIKNADSSAKILLGGLLLDCDPRETGVGYCPTEERTKGPKFLEGVLMNGGGDFFDIISYHGYTMEGDFETAPWMLEEGFPNWSTHGGVVMGKYDYINDLLNKFGYQKPVFLTETAYLCTENNLACIGDKDIFYNRQAQYSVWLLVRNWLEGIDQSFWYSYNGPGWRDGGILNKEQQPKSVYSAIQILNQRMQGAITAQKLSDLPEGLQGYAINFDNHTSWVVTSKDNNPHVINISNQDFSAFDIYNEKIEIVDGNLEIFYPVYFDFEN